MATSLRWRTHSTRTNNLLSHYTKTPKTIVKELLPIGVATYNYENSYFNYYSFIQNI